MLCATAPRRQTPFEPVEPDAFDLQFLLDSFADSDDLRTESLARAIATLSDDELMRARVMRQLPHRKERLDWVDSLAQTEVVGAMAILDSVGDGANIAVAVRFRTWPPLESETWPQSRPLLEWLLRSMPEGGTDFARPTWTDRQQAALAKATFLHRWDGPSTTGIIATGSRLSSTIARGMALETRCDGARRPWRPC